MKTLKKSPPPKPPPPRTIVSGKGRNWFEKLFGLKKPKSVTGLTKDDFILSIGKIKHCSEYYDKKQTGKYLIIVK